MLPLHHRSVIHTLFAPIPCSSGPSYAHTSAYLLCANQEAAAVLLCLLSLDLSVNPHGTFRPLDAVRVPLGVLSNTSQASESRGSADRATTQSAGAGHSSSRARNAHAAPRTAFPITLSGNRSCSSSVADGSTPNNRFAPPPLQPSAPSPSAPSPASEPPPLVSSALLLIDS